MQIITLTTDFGNDDPFDGVVKGVILGISPNANIIDLTHNIAPQDIYQANFILQGCYEYFPKGTIHVCVVDPGVGSLRKPIILQTKNYYFIGPDNGLFTSVLEKEEFLAAIELTEKKYWLDKVSHTFHGRDIFAPAAAHLANGIPLKDFGKNLAKEDLVLLKIEKPQKLENGFKGEIRYIDHFGNLISNIPNHLIEGRISGEIKDINFTGLVSNFAEAEENQLTAIKGSSGCIELFIYKSNAQIFTKAKAGDKLLIDKL